MYQLFFRLSFLFFISFTSYCLSAHGPVHEQIDQLTQQIKEQPDNIALYLERGLLYKVDEDLAKSLADFEKVLALNSKTYAAHFPIAEILLEKEDFEKALYHIDFYLEHYPNHANAYVIHGRIHQALGNDGIAILSLEKALELKGKKAKPDDYLLLAGILEKYQPEEALTVIEKGITVLGDAISLQMEIIDLSIAYSWLDRGAQEIDCLLQRTKRKETLLFKKAKLFESMEEYELAKMYYQHCLSEIQSLKPKIKQTNHIKQLKRKANTALLNLRRQP